MQRKKNPYLSAEMQLFAADARGKHSNVNEPLVNAVVLVYRTMQHQMLLTEANLNMRFLDV